MYRVRTFFGITFQYVISWEEWDLDKTFIEFEQRDGKVILPKNQIMSIENA